MNKNQEITNLEQLLDRIGAVANDGEQVSLGAILKAVGRRSFGPLLLVACLITLAPIIGDIPGMPTIMGMLVLLTAGLWYSPYFAPENLPIKPTSLNYDLNFDTVSKS